jgi:hypothetical protein
MKYGLFLLVVLAFFVPHGVLLADTTGFAPASVWVSHTPIQEGETVQLHAALNNGSDKKLTGSITFKDGSVSLGSVPFSLEAGEARIVSLSWKATAGAHAINAAITGASDSAAADSETVSVSVEPKPAPKPATAKTSSTTNAAAVEFSNADSIESTIGTLSPKVQEVTSPAFEKVDDWRKSGATFLGTQATAQEQKISDLSAKKKELAKQNSPDTKNEERKTTAFQVIATILLYVYEILLYIVSKAGIFYPVFAAIILYLLFKGYQRVRRPTRDY